MRGLLISWSSLLWANTGRCWTKFPFCRSLFLFLTFCNTPNVVTFLFRQALILPRGRFQLIPQVGCRVSSFSRFPLCLFYFIFSECIRLISLGHQWDLNSSALFTNHQTRKKITIPILPSSFLSRLTRWEENFLPRSSLGLYIYVCNPSTSLSRCL